jgi:hypothetical protein
MAWVHERTTLTEWPPLWEVSANFGGCDERDGSLQLYIRLFRLDPLLFLPSSSLTSWGNPFQTLYFSENVVAPGIEPRHLNLCSRTLTTNPQRQSFCHIPCLCVLSASISNFVTTLRHCTMITCYMFKTFCCQDLVWSQGRQKWVQPVLGRKAKKVADAWEHYRPAVTWCSQFMAQELHYVAYRTLPYTAHSMGN